MYIPKQLWSKLISKRKLSMLGTSQTITLLIYFVVKRQKINCYIAKFTKKEHQI